MHSEQKTRHMRRILALDGGGIRGIFSLQVLKRIEAIFRETRKNPELVLADEFDLFAGTSTGAIIAAGLSWGLSTREIEYFYTEHGATMFAKEVWYRRIFSKYRAREIAGLFRRTFCEDDAGKVPALFGSPKLRSLLLVVMRNASTGSPWPLSNNPHALYNDRSLPDCNLDIPLWQILRASTAAPSFFPPQEIQIGAERHLFVDGGITPFNNPALLAILMATLPAYRLEWPTGRSILHVTSIGTGASRARLPGKSAAKIHVLDQLSYVMPAVMGSVVSEQDLLCRVLGNCVHGAVIDSELGALDHPTLFAPDAQLFTYARYDQQLDARALGLRTGATAHLDDLSLMPILREIGTEYAGVHVKPEHLCIGSMERPQRTFQNKPPHIEECS